MLTFAPAVWLVGLGTLLGWLLTRFARSVAARVGMVDAPDGRRKTQDRPVPVAGGVAVLIAAVVALLITSLTVPAIGAALTAEPRQTLARLTVAFLTAVVGLADDRYNLRARYKLLGQLTAILVLVIPGGFLIERVSIFGLVVEFGPLAAACTALWLLACVNALNLIDGMDGLLGTVGGIALLSLAVIALVPGQMFAAAGALALGGAVPGVPWWHQPPAPAYLGGP